MFEQSCDFCLNTIAGVPHWFVYFERALVSRVMGNGGTTSLFFLFGCSASPTPPQPHPPFPVALLWVGLICFSVSSTGCGGSGSRWDTIRTDSEGVVSPFFFLLLLLHQESFRWVTQQSFNLQNSSLFSTSLRPGLVLNLFKLDLFTWLGLGLSWFERWFIGLIGY